MRSPLSLVRLATPLACLVVAFFAREAEAQLGGLRDAAEKVAGEAPSPSKLLEGEPPITTSLEDATFAVDSLDAFDPGSFQSLLTLERTDEGSFVLQSGAWELHAQSYCLKAGTYAPGGGDGYLFAPPAGPAEEAVEAIVRGALDRPEIPQRDIQVLLWAIIARAKFEELDAPLKATAALLLTKEQLAKLNRGALDLVPEPVLRSAMDGLPPIAQRVLQAEADLRRLLATGGSYNELERAAVLLGEAPAGEGSRPVPAGRWSLHPDGYYVRYLPSGYSHTRVQVWVPEGADGVGEEFDPAEHIAVPGNTARQRLIQSGREYREG